MLTSCLEVGVIIVNTGQNAHQGTLAAPSEVTFRTIVRKKMNKL